MLEPEERKWKLGEDLNGTDSILDGFTFNDLLLTVHCNCKVKNKAAVLKSYKEILEGRLEDALFLVENNLDELVASANKGQSEYQEGEDE